MCSTCVYMYVYTCVLHIMHGCMTVCRYVCDTYRAGSNYVIVIDYEKFM